MRARSVLVVNKAIQSCLTARTDKRGASFAAIQYLACRHIPRREAKVIIWFEPASYPQFLVAAVAVVTVVHHSDSVLF